MTNIGNIAIFIGVGTTGLLACAFGWYCYGGVVNSAKKMMPIRLTSIRTSARISPADNNV